MKNIVKKIVAIVGGVLILSACTDTKPKNYLTISGTIKNATTDSIEIADYTGVIKTMLLDENDHFSDTLNAVNTNYNFISGDYYHEIFLKNGKDVNISFDVEDGYNSIMFSGPGALENTYLNDRRLLDIKLFANHEEMMELEPNDFEEQVEEKIKELSSYLEGVKDLDTALVNAQKGQIAFTKKYIANRYDEVRTIKELKGKPSPLFADYENYAGGNSALVDFKGKYVYIDLWATWCGPCIAEIPALKEVEHDYKEKNIAFLSISVDKKNAYDKWRSMIKEKELGGVQLWNKENRDFMDAYNVQGIPRFILIDPQGTIVEASAPRPSDKKLRELFDSLPL